MGRNAEHEQEWEAPHGQECEAPHEQEWEAPHGQEWQAPCGQEWEAPHGQEWEAPHGQEGEALHASHELDRSRKLGRKGTRVKRLRKSSYAGRSSKTQATGMRKATG